MGCEYFEMPDGGRAIICSRGGARARAKCEFCRQAVHEVLCDFVIPSKGSRQKTCSRRVCRKCAQHVGDDRDLCPPHARLVASVKVAPELLADPEPFAMNVVTDIVEASLETASSSDDKERRLRLHLPERDLSFKPRDFADWMEYRTERAAIFEYCGEVERTVADTMARELAGPSPRYSSAGPLFAGAR